MVPISIALLSACHPPSPKPEETATVTPAADTTPVTSGALAGPIGLTGIHSVVVPPDSSDAGMAISGFRVSAFSQDRVGSPLRLLLRAPTGEETGRRPEWTATKEEVAASQYTPAGDDSEAMENEEWVRIDSAVPGRYMVLLIQTREERYNLDLSVERADGGKYQGGAWNLPATPGTIDTIWIEITAGNDTAIVRRTGPPAR
jgi:hypothetical protein